MTPQQPSPAPASAVARLAELAWQVYAGDYAALRRIVEATGGRWRTGATDTTQTADTCHGMTVGFSPGTDPTNTLIQVNFALFGERWFQVPEACNAQLLVNQQWDARTRALRGQSPRPGPRPRRRSKAMAEQQGEPEILSTRQHRPPGMRRVPGTATARIEWAWDWEPPTIWLHGDDRMGFHAPAAELPAWIAALQQLDTERLAALAAAPPIAGDG